MRWLFNSDYFFFPPPKTTRSGDARKILEYVPKNIPIVSTSAKYRVDSGPNTNRARSTKITVSEVFIERVNV